MRKVKVILASSDFCYECDGKHNIHPISTEWEEVDDEEYDAIRSAVSYANVSMNGYSKYVLVEYHDDIMSEVFRKSSEFAEKMAKKEAAEKKRAAEAKRKRDEKARERKLKQLEKLKKELGDV